jgi:hypothetical protein
MNLLIIKEINMTIVTLKDGTQIPRDALYAISRKLSTLESNKIALYDLVNKCKSPLFQVVRNPASKSKEILQGLDLIDENEAIHDIVKKVVLNSIEGNGFTLRLANPIKIEGRDAKPIYSCGSKSKCFMLALIVVGAVGVGLEYCRRHHPEYFDMLPIGR